MKIEGKPHKKPLKEGADYISEKRRQIKELNKKIDEEFKEFIDDEIETDKESRELRKMTERGVKESKAYDPSEDLINYKQNKEIEERHMAKKFLGEMENVNTKRFDKRAHDLAEKKQNKENPINKVAELFKTRKIDQILIAGEKVSIPDSKEKIQGARPDLDAYTALYLLNNYSTKPLDETYGEKARTTILRKDKSEQNATEKALEKSVANKNIYNKEKFGDDNENIKGSDGLKVYVDNGGEWIKIDDGGETTTVYIDHHGEGIRDATSGTKMMLEIMEKAGILKEVPPWLKKFTDFVTDVDNLSYVEKKDKKGKKTFTESYFRNEWPNSLYALAEKKIPFETLMGLFESGKIEDPSKPFTEEEIKGEMGDFKVGDKTIRDLCKEQREDVNNTLKGIKNSIDFGKKMGLSLETDELGKIVYQDYFRINGETNIILDHLAMKATVAKGFESYVSWNKKKGKFFINSLESKDLDKIAERLNTVDPGCATEVRGKFIFGTINKLTEEDFLNILNPVILKNGEIKKQEKKRKSGNKKDGQLEEKDENLEKFSSDISLLISSAIEKNLADDPELKAYMEKELPNVIASFEKLYESLSEKEEGETIADLTALCNNKDLFIERVKIEINKNKERENSSETNIWIGEKQNEEPNKKINETISDEEYNKFVDSNIVSDDILNKISDKNIKGEPLSLREQAIFSNNVKKIEKILSDKKESSAEETQKTEIINEAKDTEQQIETEAEKQIKENIKNTEDREAAEKQLEAARNKYLVEYKKCEKEADKQKLIDKTRNAVFNLLAGVKNIFSKNKIEYKKPITVEDYFTKEATDAKNEYNKSKVELGNQMYNQRKSELEKAGLKGPELEQALTNYKATEILSKTIINERQKLIDARAEGKPINPALWKKLLDGYLSIKPRWKRVALSTILLLPVSAAGAFASYGAIGVAGLATVKFASSMAIGAAVGHTAKGIDWVRSDADAKFKQDQQNSKAKLQERFSKNEIDPEEYESGILSIEEAEKKRARNRMLVKAGVGAALAFTAGYVAYDAMGNGMTHLPTASAPHTTIDAVSGPDLSNVAHHVNIEATADHGQGAISTIRELQHNLKVEYGEHLDQAPASVKHILGTDAHKLAQEYGMYKPGQDAESAFIKSGSSFKVDGSGNVTYNEIGGHSITLEKGVEIKASNLYEGRMSDTDHSGLKNISHQTETQINPETGLPMHSGTGQINPETGLPMEGSEHLSGGQINPETGLPINPSVNPDQINPETGLPIHPQETSGQVNPETGAKIPSGNNIDKPEVATGNTVGEYLSGNKTENIDVKYFFNNDYVKNLKPNEIQEMIKAGTLVDHPKMTLLGVEHHYSLNGADKINQLKSYAESYGLGAKPEEGETMIGYQQRMNDAIDVMKDHFSTLSKIKEIHIDSLRDLKAVTNGYENVPGQPSLRHIMDEYARNGYHAIKTESVGQTFTAAQIDTDAKLNSVMSAMKKNVLSGPHYEYLKELPNGNVQVMQLRFYK